MGTFKIKMKAMLALVMLFMTANVFADPPSWDWIKSTSNTTTIAGEIVINDYDARYTALNMTVPPTVIAGDYIGAFVDGQCRMIAEIFDHEGTLYISGVIHGPAPESNEDPILDMEEVSFVLWDESDNASIDLLGTESTNPEGSIGVYPDLVLVGQPNDGSLLESLEVTGISLEPAFNASEITYDVQVDLGGSVPAADAYAAIVADSRATVEIVEATSATAPDNVTTITVTAENGDETVYTITYSEIECDVVAPQAISRTECADADLTITVSTDINEEPITGSIYWYDNAELAGTPVEGTSIEVTETATFFVTQFLECESGATEVTLTVNELPVVEITNTTLVVCAGEVVIPEVTATPEGGNGTWSTIPAGLIVGGQLNTTEAQDIDVIYTYAEECPNSDTVTFSVNAGPSAPVPVEEAVVACQGATIPQLEVTADNGATVNWFNAAGEPLGEGATLTVDAEGVYKAVQSVGSCVSDTAAITVTVNPIPDAPIISVEGETTVCSIDDMPTLSADGTSIQWYINEDPQTQGPTFTPSGAGGYYATQTVEGCPSANSDIVEITVADLPVIDVTVPASVCATGGEVALTPQAGGEFSINTEVITSFDPADFTNDITIDYVLSDGTCESTETYSVAITSTPDPTASDVTVILNETVPALTATADGTISWYNTEGEFIQEGASYDTGIASDTPSRTTFYVSNTIDGCESALVAVVLAVTDCDIPAPTVEAPAPVCANVILPTLTATGIETGNQVNWYSDSDLQILVAENSETYTPTEAGTYYATQVGSCASSSATVSVVVNPLTEVTENVPQYICETDDAIELAQYFEPAGVTFPDYADGQFNPSTATGVVAIDYTYTDDNECITTGSASIEVVTAPAVSIVESTEACVGTVIELNPTPADGVLTVNDITTTETSIIVEEAIDYVITYTVENEACTATATATITGVAAPAAPAIESETIDVNETVPAFGTGNDNLRWYADADLSDLIAEGEFTPSVSEAGIYTYYVTEINNATCESAMTIVTLTINGDCPVLPPVVSDVAICTYDESAALEAVPAVEDGLYDMNWYRATNPDVIYHTGDILNAEPGTYYVAEYNLNANCESSRTEVVVSEIEVPTVVIGNISPSICEGEVAPELTGTASGNIYWVEQTDAPVVPLTGTPSATYTSEVQSGTVIVWAVQELEGCQSEPVSVSYSFVAQPDPISIENQTVCEGTYATFVADGQTVRWATAEGDEISTNVEFVSSETAVGVYSYTASVLENGCYSEASSFELTIAGMPTISVEGDYLFVQPSENPVLEVTSSGETISWINENDEEVSTSTTYTYPSTDNVVTSFEVTATSGECSASVTVNLTITTCDIPAPELESSTVYLCEGETIPEINAVQSPLATSITWLDADGTVVSQETAFTPEVAGTYTVYQEGSCVSPSSIFELIITPIPTPSITVASSIAVDAGLVPLTVDPAGGNLTGAIVDADGAIAGSSPYYSVDPAVAGLGVHEVTYSVTVNTCVGSVTEEFEIVDDIVVLDTVDLINTIDSAAAIVADAVVGAAVGNVSQDAVDALEAAIAEANAVLDTATVQVSINEALTAIENAISAYNDEVIPDEFTGISISLEDTELEVGDIITPTVIIQPEGLSVVPEITWLSTNTTVATVVDSTGEVTAVGAGDASIVALVEYAGRTYTDTLDISIIGSGTTTDIEFESAEAISDNQIAVEFTGEIETVVNGAIIDFIVTADSTINVLAVQIDPADSHILILTLSSSIAGEDNLSVTFNNSSNRIQGAGGRTVSSFNGESVIGYYVSIDATLASIIVYPTEASTTVYVDGAEEVTSMVVVNALGQVVLSGKTDGASKLIIDITTISEGLYTLNLYTTNGKVVSKKIIKK